MATQTMMAQGTLRQRHRRLKSSHTGSLSNKHKLDIIARKTCRHLYSEGRIEMQLAQLADRSANYFMFFVS